MDGEVVHALLTLLDQRITINLPGKLLGFAPDFFQRLVNRHRADGNGAVTDDPLAGDVDVPAGREVHDRIRAPLRGPPHFFDFLVDARGDGGIADVGVDFHQEVAANNHWLQFRMIDVGRDDRTAARHFGADEFGRDPFRNARAPRVAGVLMVEQAAGLLIVLDEIHRRPAAHVFTDGDEFHFGRDDALAGVPKLCDRMAASGAQRFAPQPGESLLIVAPRLAGKIPGHARMLTIVLGFDFAAFIFLHVAATLTPLAPQRGQALLEVSVERRIAPGAAAVIDTHRLVRLDLAVEGFRRAEVYLAERHADIRVDLSSHVNAVRIERQFAVVRLERFFGCDHMFAFVVCAETFSAIPPNNAGCSRAPPEAW